MTDTATNGSIGDSISKELMLRQTRMDPEVVELCKAINAIQGLETTSSCCGHGDTPFHIWFRVSYVKALYPITRCIDTRYGGAPTLPDDPYMGGWGRAWRCMAVDTDTAVEGQPGVCGVKFLLEGPTGELGYTQATELAGRIHRFFENADKYGHDYGVKLK